MSTAHSPIVFTEVEVRSQVPSGWGIAGSGSGRWDASSGSWSVDLRDGADNVWKVTLSAGEVEKSGRIGALGDQIRRLERKALGRKSIISG